MADFIKTITNSVNLFGNNPSSKWGNSISPYTFTWGVTKWGEGTFSIVFSIEKLISNALVPDTIIIKSSEKFITNGLTIAEDLYSEKLSDGTWDYVFVSDTSEAENRSTSTWSDVAQTTASYTCSTAGSTTWM